MPCSRASLTAATTSSVLAHSGDERRAAGRSCALKTARASSYPASPGSERSPPKPGHAERRRCRLVDMVPLHRIVVQSDHFVVDEPPDHQISADERGAHPSRVGSVPSGVADAPTPHPRPDVRSDERRAHRSAAGCSSASSASAPPACCSAPRPRTGSSGRSARSSPRTAPAWRRCSRSAGSASTPSPATSRRGPGPTTRCSVSGLVDQPFELSLRRAWPR